MAASSRPRWPDRRAEFGVPDRIVGGGTIAAAGGKWLPEDTALDLSFALTIAIWVTVGRAWLQPRKWPRLLTAFAIVAGVWLFILSPLWAYLTWPYR